MAFTVAPSLPDLCGKKLAYSSTVLVSPEECRSSGLPVSVVAVQTAKATINAVQRRRGIRSTKGRLVSPSLDFEPWTRCTKNGRKCFTGVIGKNFQPYGELAGALANSRDALTCLNVSSDPDSNLRQQTKVT
jgi:hypothetical protein